MLVGPLSGVVDLQVLRVINYPVRDTESGFHAYAPRWIESINR